MSIKNITIQNQLQQLQLNDVELEDPSSFNVFRKKIVISFVIILLFFAYSDKIWAQIEGLYNSSTEQFAGISTLMSATLYANTEAIEQAILVVSVEIMQSVTAPGNTSADLEFNPQPFVLGRSLQNRVMGLLSPYIDVSTMAQ